jgi:hypothetical protein
MPWGRGGDASAALAPWPPPCSAGAPYGFRVPPVPHLHCPLPCPQTLALPYKNPHLAPLCAAAASFGVSFPKSAVATTRLKKEGGVGGRKEAREAGEKPGVRCGAWAAMPCWSHHFAVREEEDRKGREGGRRSRSSSSRSRRAAGPHVVVRPVGEAA